MKKAVRFGTDAEKIGRRLSLRTHGRLQSVLIFPSEVAKLEFTASVWMMERISLATLGSLGISRV